MKRIFTSNWDNVAKNFEDPDCDMQQALREMEKAVFELRAATASALTEGKLIERKVKELQNEKSRWQKTTELAIVEDRHDLARRALSQKKQVEKEIDQSISSLNRADENAEGMKEELKKAEEKFSQMQNRFRLLKHQRLMAHSGVQATASQVGNVEDLEQRFKNLELEAEKHLLQQEAMEELSAEEELAEEFKALKNKINSKEHK